MTRAAVRAGFVHFVDRAVDATADAFSVGRALGGRSGPATRAIDGLAGRSDALHERLVAPELAAYRTQVLDQFQTLLDAVESDEPIAAHREAVLARDAFVDALRGDLPAARRVRIEDEIFAHHAALGEAVRPLLAAEADDFWPAAAEALTVPETEALVRDHFVFTEPLVAHRDAFRFAATIDPGMELEFTDEAIRAMRRAERQVVGETLAEVDSRLG